MLGSVALWASVGRRELGNRRLAGFSRFFNLPTATRGTLPPLVAAVRAGKPGIDLRVLKVGRQKFPHAEFGLANALFKKK